MADRLVVTTSRTGRPTGGHTVLLTICKTFVNTTCVVVATVGTTSITDSGSKIHRPAFHIDVAKYIVRLLIVVRL